MTSDSDRPGEPADMRSVLAEDRLLWQFWVNKGMRPEPLAACLSAVPRDANWDYIAGNSLYGGFEQGLYEAVKGHSVPPGFLERLARDVEGDPHAVTPTTREGQLLILCASPRMLESEQEEVARLASGSVHWDSIVQAAARANLTVVVHHNFRRLGLLEALPGELADVLAARAAGISSRNQRMLDLLEEVIGLMRAEKMRVLLLKESALALTHYLNGRLRMMGDIDLLLPHSNLENFVSMLEARGYSSAEIIWTKKHYEGHHHHAAPLVDAERAVKIEPHRTIALPELPGGSGSGSADLIAGMSERAVRVDADSWCFTPADTLFHLCLDIFGNAFLGKMGQLCDAREVVRQGGVEWPLLEDLARRTGAEAHLCFSLGLLRMARTEIPDDVFDRLATARKPSFAATKLRSMAERNLFGYVRSTARASRAGEKLLFASLMRPYGWIGRQLFLVKRYLYLDVTVEGVGDLARQARPSKTQALARLASLPWRTLRRWTSSRRMP